MNKLLLNIGRLSTNDILSWTADQIKSTKKKFNKAGHQYRQFDKKIYQKNKLEMHPCAMPEAPSIIKFRKNYGNTQPLFLKWEAHTYLSYEVETEINGMVMVEETKKEMISSDYGVGMHKVNVDGKPASYRIRAVASGNRCRSSKSEFSEPFSTHKKPNTKQAKPPKKTQK